MFFSEAFRLLSKDNCAPPAKERARPADRRGAFLRLPESVASQPWLMLAVPLRRAFASCSAIATNFDRFFGMGLPPIDYTGVALGTHRGMLWPGSQSAYRKLG